MLKKKNEIAEITISAGSALVGFILDGPVGAVVGGALPPALKYFGSLWKDYKERQKKRLTGIVENAFSASGMTDEEIYAKLKVNPSLTDEIIRMIRQLETTNPELDQVFSTIISNVIVENEKEQKRLIVLYDAIKGMNTVQLELLKLIYENGGRMSAEDLANDAGVPEIDLRNAVRDLELRGMIIDNNEEPTIWTLRELGLGIAQIYCKKGE